MRVRDVLKGKGDRIISIGPEATVGEALARLVENNIGALPVIDGERHLLGMLSERDLMRGIHARGAGFTSETVSAVMTRDPHSCDLDANVEEVMGTMSEYRIAKVPVLCDAKLCGIVSVGDVVKFLYERVRSENHQLLSYIHGSY